MTIGPSVYLGSITHLCHWPHPSNLAFLFMGPFMIYAAFIWWAHLGFTDILALFARGLLRIHRQYFAPLCDSPLYRDLNKEYNNFLNRSYNKDKQSGP
jgi:hypothetical protein